jgi:hypothetical protein
MVTKREKEMMFQGATCALESVRRVVKEFIEGGDDVVLAASLEHGLDRAIKMAELLNDQLDDLLASANAAEERPVSPRPGPPPNPVSFEKAP